MRNPIASLFATAAMALGSPGVHAAKPAKAPASAPAASGAAASEAARSPDSAAAAPRPSPVPAEAPATRVDINAASPGLLEQRLGVDSRTAQAIVKNRPYESTDDLVTRLVLSNKDFKRIKDRVTVGPASRNP